MKTGKLIAFPGWKFDLGPVIQFFVIFHSILKPTII